jgi:hypothetical protein
MLFVSALAFYSVVCPVPGSMITILRKSLVPASAAASGLVFLAVVSLFHPVTLFKNNVFPYF